MLHSLCARGAPLEGYDYGFHARRAENSGHGYQPGRQIQ
jgi:hypothetical protein